MSSQAPSPKLRVFCAWNTRETVVLFQRAEAVSVSSGLRRASRLTLGLAVAPSGIMAHIFLGVFQLPLVPRFSAGY